jgi:hypothetical protein
MSRRGVTREYRIFSWFIRIQRRTVRTVDEADWVQNAEEVQENTRRGIQLLKDHPDILQEHVNLTHNMNARLRDELQKQCQTEGEKLELGANTSFQETSDMEKEQMRRKLRAAVEKAERLEIELQTIRKLMEDETADRI